MKEFPAGSRRNMPISANKSLHSTIILSCSPRIQGNTDSASAVLFESLVNAGTLPVPELIYLRNYHVLPCISCGACAAFNDVSTFSRHLDFLLNACPLSVEDDASALLDVIASGTRIFILSPIYFYHLPAAFKALIDRIQPFYVRQRRPVIPMSEKICYPVLIAGRARGDSLFSGSILTLKYAFGSLGMRLGRPLFLSGLDESGALMASTDALDQLTAYARTIMTGAEK